MKRVFFIMVALMVGALPVLAQDFEYPKAEVYGGYLLIHEEGVTTNGVLTSVEGNFNRYIGIVGEFGYGAQTNKELEPGVSVKLREYNFMAGPRLSYRADKFRLFAHALYGGNRMSADATVSGSHFLDGASTDFAMAYGGGVDISANKWLSIRLAQVDWLVTHWNIEQENGWSSQLRYSGGIVFKLGSRSK